MRFKRITRPGPVAEGAPCYRRGVPRASANGVSLYYEERGAGDPILCIHGGGSSAAVWGPALDELAGRGRVVAYDRRGSSRSERPEPYATDVAQQAEDAAALLEALGAAPAIVIGRSYGGTIGIELALRRPGAVRALVLLEPALLSLTESARRWHDAVERRVLLAAESDPGTVGETFLRSVLGDSSWEGMPGPVRQIFTDNGPAIAAELRGGVPELDAEALSSIAVPSLLVAAKESAPVFTEPTAKLAAAMPSARLRWIEGGHLIDPAHPVVLDFLDEVLARSDGG